ncbi:MAG: HesA/MoeB/ThiF family protein [Asticcacaulis sp.]
MLTDEEIDRYARHLVLKEIGGMGQTRLKAAKVGLIGMGGIGAPASMYLAAAGVGTLIMIDDDTVEISNLQRQIIYSENDVGLAKGEAAMRTLSEFNGFTDLTFYGERLDEDNAADIIAGCDIVLDGCDNFQTRLLVNRICHELKKPLVSAAIGRWSGQLAVFDGSPCYQCLVPEVPPDADTCERVGVVGALAGVMGSMAALEVVKLITGAGEPLRGRLMVFDGLTMNARTINLLAEPDCPVCGGIDRDQ